MNQDWKLLTFGKIIKVFVPFANFLLQSLTTQYNFKKWIEIFRSTALHLPYYGTNSESKSLLIVDHT